MRHGSVYQIIDPWTTTDWGAVWQQLILKRLALGDTIGEAYEQGMRVSAPEFSANQWWWDVWENVELFGDPDLRPYVPSTEFSDKNYWEQQDTLPMRYTADVNIDGHTPFGAEEYPYRKEPRLWFEENMVLVLIIAVVVVLVCVLVVYMKVHRSK